MIILYNQQTGVLTRTNAEFAVPGEGEGKAEGDFMLMDKGPEFYRYNGVFVVPREEAEVYRDLASSAFDFEKLVGTLFQRLPINRIKDLGTQTGTLQWLVVWKNWVGINAFLNLLLSDNSISQEELTTIKGCFLEQGIDLDFFAASPA